jgi:hypothetical protein
MVLKYQDSMHRYIETEMDFLDISSLGAAYRYAINIKQKLKQKMQQFGHGNPSQQNLGKGAPTHRTKDREKKDLLRTTFQAASKEGHRKDK